MNFIYNLGVTYEEVLRAVSNFIERHGKCLWHLHIMSSEICISLKDGNVTPIRCVIENVSGFIVNYHAYQEITTDKGTMILKSIGEEGPLHLQPVDQPYPMKESQSDIVLNSLVQHTCTTFLIFSRRPFKMSG